MTDRPKWSAGGFAQRVAMSDKEFWIIVEGRDHDRPHYERLMRSMDSTAGRKFSIRLAEETKVDGKAAGGKEHALALHDKLAKSHELTQKNKALTSQIVFFLDRDRDDFSGLLRTGEHVFYTHGSDVEADILANSDVWSAISMAYGIDDSLTWKIRREVTDLPTSLMSLWRDWLELGLTALATGSPGHAPWSQLSMVNIDQFGPVDIDAVTQAVTKIRTSCSTDEYEAAGSKAARHLKDNGTRLLKGRWLSRYIRSLVKVHLADEVVRAKVSPDAVIDTALSSLDYRADWTASYDRGFQGLLAEA
jgi:hypothetical protein